MNTLLGVCNNITQHIDKVKVWANSFKFHCENDRIVLLCVNSSEDERSKIQALGIEAVPVAIEDTWTINHQRLGSTIEFLSKDSSDGLILITDVFDVVFQGNPFLKHDVSKYDVFLTGEGVNVSEEPWNSDNIHKLFPEDFKGCLSTPVVCSGIICGKRAALLELYGAMYFYCENKSTKNHNIKDQAALIVMLSKNLVQNVKIYELDEGWAMHCAVSGPTQFFDGWGFRHKLTSKGTTIPHMDETSGLVKTGEKVYDMVHQFNRVPQWHTALISKWII